MSYTWHWAIFFELSPDGANTYWQMLLLGAAWTLATALVAWTLALTFGSIIGVIRTTPFSWLVRLGDGYVELFRNVPLLVQMFLWYFVLPELLPVAWGDWLKQLPNASFWTGVAALGFYTSPCRAASGSPRWRSASRSRKPTCTCCCPWATASSCRR